LNAQAEQQRDYRSDVAGRCECWNARARPCGAAVAARGAAAGIGLRVEKLVSVRHRGQSRHPRPRRRSSAGLVDVVVSLRAGSGHPRSREIASSAFVLGDPDSTTGSCPPTAEHAAVVLFRRDDDREPHALRNIARPRRHPRGPSSAGSGRGDSRRRHNQDAARTRSNWRILRTADHIQNISATDETAPASACHVWRGRSARAPARSGTDVARGGITSKTIAPRTNTIPC